MRLTTVLLTALPFVASLPNPLQALATFEKEAPYHIILSRRALSAGEQVEMKPLPRVPPGLRVTWPEATGKTNLIYSAIYRAL